MAARTAPKTTTPDMETTTATATATNAKTTPPTPMPGTSKQSAREERRARRRGEAIDAIRLLQDALPLVSESTTSDADSDDCSTIENTSTEESAMDTDDFQLPSARRQLKRKGSRNSSSVSDRRERPGTKPVTVGEFQPVQSVPNQPKAKDARVPAVVLREKAREAPQGRYPRCLRGDHRGGGGLRCDQPSVSARIPQKDGAARRPTPLVFVQLTKSDERKKIFSVTHVCGMNVTVESKRVKKVQATQCHRCQLYGHGQRNCHAAAVCVKCARPHQTAECAKPRDVPAKCALCSGPHTASYRGCPKSPYSNRTQKAGNQEAAAPDPERGPYCHGDGRPKAVDQHREAKTVARKPKASGKPKTPATTTGPKPTPKKPETLKPGKPAKPAVAKKSARDVSRTRTAKTEPDATSTLALLISPFQRINWTKLQGVATTLLPQLLARPRKPQPLQIAFWNANGLTTKKTELEQFVQRYQLDVVLIGETHLRASNRLTLPNFRVYRADREDARGGGTAILVKSTIEHHADLALELINIEATAVTVNLATGPVKLVAAYKAPRQRVPVPLINGARDVAFTTEDKAESFAEALERQCSPVYENADVDRIGRIHRQVRDLLMAEEDEEPIRPTSPEEVKAIVKSFRPNKAPGPDGIIYRALKHAPMKFVMHMTNICNAMLRLRHFPSQCKQADVAMILRPGRSHKWRKSTGPSSSGHGQDRRPDNTYQTAGGNGRPRLYLRLPIRVPQRAQHHSPGAAPRRTHKRGLQPTGMHRSGIPRRRQSLRQGLAPEPTPEDAPGRHFQGNGQAHSLLSPQEDLQSQAGRTAVHNEDGHSRRAAKVSDLISAVQHLHQRHPDNRACQPGDVHGRCLHLFKVLQRQSDRPTSPECTRHFAGLVRKVENRRPSPEKHGRAFRDRRSPKKEVRQRAGSHLPRRHHSLATRSQILGVTLVSRVNWATHVHRVLDRGLSIRSWRDEGG
ncbi:hypothetical protein Trydic_g13294 [Trypoxylus dichotomus]